MKKSGSTQFQLILFDLDETLYPKEAGLMKALSERMLQFMIHRLDIRRRPFFLRRSLLLMERMFDDIVYFCIYRLLRDRFVIGPCSPLMTPAISVCMSPFNPTYCYLTHHNYNLLMVTFFVFLFNF